MWLSSDIQAATPGPGDDFWYQPVGMMSSSGVAVSPDSALRLAAVYACVRVIAESLAQVPLLIYQRLDDDGKQRARNHPLFSLMHRRPNRWQTAYEWKELMTSHVALRGNGYSEIISAPNGRVMELIPRHPDRVQPEILDNGGIRYIYTEGNRQRVIAQGEMFHLRGLSSDGYIGLNPIEVEREAIGLGLAAQDYGARFYQNGANPGGVIEWEGNFKDNEARGKFRESWQHAQTGANRHKTAVLEHGMKYHELGLKHTDAQYLETRKYQDTDIARIFRVPPHMIGILDRATHSNIEQQAIEFVVHTLGPWFKRWEEAIGRDLIVREDEFFAEFLAEGLLRGDSVARSQFYHNGISDGWMTRNEVRKRENLNPLEGLDEPLQPLNMAPAGSDPQEPPERSARLKAKAAERVVTKELRAVRRAYSEMEPAAFADWADDFFAEHAGWVEDVLAIDSASAQRYAASCRAALDDYDNVPRILGQWEDRKAPVLAELE